MNPTNIENIANDISGEGQEKMIQNFHGQKFPKQDGGRSFQPNWIDKFAWIEYSKQLDRVFCYPCRQFGLSKPNDVFVAAGYSNWKQALTAKQGFQKHENCALHIKSMLSWKEKQTRMNVNQPVSNLLNNVVLEKRRYYFKAIVETIFFLISNELPFRGSWDYDEKVELGLFNSLFNYIMKRDQHLQECQLAMPANATYKSSTIQNELIQLIADELQKLIVAEINNSSYITLMADGAKDKSRNELVSIAFRYITDGVPKETLVAIEKTDSLTAAGFKDLIISTLDRIGIKTEKIISQCYDGAPVMSGHDGGLQKLIEKHYNRSIPYVHCFNHKLHLVVEAVASNVNTCRLFFGEVQLLYNFFERFKVKQIYAGKSVPRLLEQRWSGHLYAVQVIQKNYFEIVSTLTKIIGEKSKDFEPVDVALAKGILKSIKKISFIFMLHSMNGLLGALEPANKILQTRDVGFRHAMPVIQAVFENVQRLRSDESFKNFSNETEKILTRLNPPPPANQDQIQNEPSTSRVRQRSTRLADSIVTGTLGERPIMNDYGALKSPYLEVIGYVLNEMERRFHNNNDILTAISELNNICSDDFEKTALAPLTEIGLILPSDSELDVAKQFICNEAKKPENRKTSILKLLHPVKDAFPTTYRLFEACETFGSSTAINECSFSAVGRIDTVRRMCMNDDRLRNLSFLTFEKKRLEALDYDNIMHKFAEKDRKIQLY